MQYHYRITNTKLPTVDYIIEMLFLLTALFYIIAKIRAKYDTGRDNREEIMGFNFALEVRNISKRFKDQDALKDISFNADPGSISGFVGHNGSGKTVLFKCICGFYSVSNGEIYIEREKKWE